jgi:lipid A 3-O-deacylase
LIKCKIAVIAASLFILCISNASCGEKNTKDQKSWLNDIRVGILLHDGTVRNQTGKEGGADFNTEFIFNWPHCVPSIGIVQSNIGISLNNQGETSKIYSGFLWEYVWHSGIFFNLGLGLSLHNGELETDNGDKKELGSRLLFRIPVEFGVFITRHHGLSIMFDHVSNASLASPNDGLNTIGVRYTYRFLDSSKL